MKIINYLNRIITFSFYALFLLTPLIFTSKTSELFEFPKMWFVFGLTLLITTSWFAKMIFHRQLSVQRTPLDIPIVLFLLSQIISTVASIDPHVSLWGYYSRFNGGLISTIAYIMLYYALVSNLALKQILKLLSVGLYSGLIVAAWGLPSHFGYDPTCFIFRGNFDTSCWTEAFKPTIRIFSTLGQPAWLAAFMGILTPLSMAYFLGSKLTNSENSKENKELRSTNYGFKGNSSLTSYFLLLTSLLFYASLTYTDTRGGFIAYWVANLLFWGGLYVKNIFERNQFIKYFVLFNAFFLLFNFFQGSPINQLPTLSQLKNSPNSSQEAAQPTPSAGALGGTDSGKIRLLVWQGALDAWQDHKLFGTGVETFAYAYYQYKPKEHNLTSEWDFLYNKAHNEYLNYLTTTGIFGLGSYLLMIGAFLFIAFTKILKKKGKMENVLLVIGLIAGYIAILGSNFFGFSVVIVNLYFFLIPAFVFILGGFLNPKKVISKTFDSSVSSGSSKTSVKQWILLIVLLLITCSLSLSLINYFRADNLYNIGSGLNKSGSYHEGYQYLLNAAKLKPYEPVYKDELSLSLGTLAAGLALQKDASGAALVNKEAIGLSDDVIATHPNNVVFLKNRVRLFYTLSEGDADNKERYLKEALSAIEKAQKLAPNDAKIAYNVGVLTGQTGDVRKGIILLEKAVNLKPDYKDAYFALGLFYDEVGERQKAIETMEYILKNIDPNDPQAKEMLEEWKKSES